MSSLIWIIGQFPKHADIIQVLFLADDDFRTLCEDYYISKMRAEKLKGKILEDLHGELEYLDLSSTLEKEIIEYIKNRE
jgi:hypothetical protein